MRRLPWLLVAWLLATTPVCAQIFPIPPAPRDVLEDGYPVWPPFPSHAVHEPPESYPPDDFHFWARCEYMLGWVRATPVPVALVTTGDTKNKTPGAIGQSGTVILQGREQNGFRVIDGVNFAVGAWLDADHRFGVQVSGYVQEVGVNHFFAASNGTGTPVIALPFSNTTPNGNGERAILIANPKKLAGGVTVDSYLQRWGEDVAGLWCFYRQPGLSFTFLAGARHDDLLENLKLHAQSTSLTSSLIKTLDDRFTTRNQFIGSQIGGSVHWQYGVLYLDVTGKLGLGDTRQYVEIQGDSFQQTATKTTTFNGGLFAQPSNSGRISTSNFTAMPILEAKLGYQLTPHIRTFVGYDCLYWSGVVRPGNQIDRNINLTQDPILGAAKGVLSGPASPTPQFNRSGFWAQDVNFGFEFRF